MTIKGLQCLSMGKSHMRLDVTTEAREEVIGKWSKESIGIGQKGQAEASSAHVDIVMFQIHAHFRNVSPLEADNDARESRIIADVPTLHNTTVTPSGNWLESRVSRTMGCPAVVNQVVI